MRTPVLSPGASILDLRGARWCRVAKFGVLSCLAILLIATAARAELLVHYTFDATERRITNHGSLGAKAELRMYDGIGVAAELRTDDTVQGVNGRALRLSATHDQFGSFAHALPLSLNIGDGFTVTGWLRVERLREGAYILRNAHQENGFDIYVGDARALVLRVAGIEVASSAQALLEGEWMFFAVTWRRSSEGQAVVEFYRGNAVPASAMDKIGEGTGGESVRDAGMAFIVGNSAQKDQPFEGLIDELRIYNEALNVDQLETLRKSLR